MVISSERVMWLITMATRLAIVRCVLSQGQFAVVPAAAAGAPAAGGVWAPAGAAARASAAPVIRAANDAPNVRDLVTGTAFPACSRTSVAAPRALHHSRGIQQNPAHLLRAVRPPGHRGQDARSLLAPRTGTGVPPLGLTGPATVGRPGR